MSPITFSSEMTCDAAEQERQSHEGAADNGADGEAEIGQYEDESGSHEGLPVRASGHILDRLEDIPLVAQPHRGRWHGK
jgi:hypothetical protein